MTPIGVITHRLRATILQYLEEASPASTLILALPEKFNINICSLEHKRLNSYLL